MHYSLDTKFTFLLKKTILWNFQWKLNFSDMVSKIKITNELPSCCPLAYDSAALSQAHGLFHVLLPIEATSSYGHVLYVLSQ